MSNQDSSRMGTTQAVAYTGTAGVTSSGFGTETYQIRVCASSACHYLIGTSPTAVAGTDVLLPANWIEYVTVTPGQKISFVTCASDGLITGTDGTAYVTELS